MYVYLVCVCVCIHNLIVASYLFSMSDFPTAFQGMKKYKRKSGKIMCSSLMQILLFLTFPCTNIPLYQTFLNRFMFFWLYSLPHPTHSAHSFPRLYPREFAHVKARFCPNTTQFFLTLSFNSNGVLSTYTILPLHFPGSSSTPWIPAKLPLPKFIPRQK